MNITKTVLDPLWNLSFLLKGQMLDSEYRKLWFGFSGSWVSDKDQVQIVNLGNMSRAVEKWERDEKKAYNNVSNMKEVTVVRN